MRAAACVLLTAQNVTTARHGVRRSACSHLAGPTSSSAWLGHGGWQEKDGEQRAEPGNEAPEVGRRRRVGEMDLIGPGEGKPEREGDDEGRHRQRSTAGIGRMCASSGRPRAHPGRIRRRTALSPARPGGLIDGDGVAQILPVAGREPPARWPDVARGQGAGNVRPGDNGERTGPAEQEAALERARGERTRHAAPASGEGDRQERTGLWSPGPPELATRRIRPGT